MRSPLFKKLKEITLGPIVGQGGFCTVSSLQSVSLCEINDVSDQAARERRAFADSIATEKYVVKRLSTELPQDEHDKAVEDLAVEADVLQVLSHANIVQMAACANCNARAASFFVVLEQLSGTLEQKMIVWSRAVSQATGYWMPVVGYCCSNTMALHQVWKERMQAALQISQGLLYLHSCGLVYRDLVRTIRIRKRGLSHYNTGLSFRLISSFRLANTCKTIATQKPDNIGYSADNQIKIFDFGLVKRLDTVQKTENGRYCLTGNTGSLRYMAPEVALDLPYTNSVDCYSFGMIFWQICSLATPYAGYSQKTHFERVVQNGERPVCDPTWPPSWIELMEACWDADPDKRPAFDSIVNELELRCDELDEEEGIVPNRASDIRAKARRKAVAQQERLDVDTRIATPSDAPTSKLHDVDIV
jgi:serine/threonine protein kinase